MITRVSDHRREPCRYCDMLRAVKRCSKPNAVGKSRRPWPSGEGRYESTRNNYSADNMRSGVTLWRGSEGDRGSGGSGGGVTHLKQYHD